MNLDPFKQLQLYGYENYFNELKNLYIKNKLPNKILLNGKKGIGKCTFANHFINFILSNDEEDRYDDNNYLINSNNKSFKLIINKSSPNFFLIKPKEDKKNIEIDQIRELIDFCNKSSFNNKPRFVIIDDIEYLNLNSSNALLKILEEPNNGIYFILINNSSKILSTIKSRCLTFNISFNFETIKKIFSQITKLEINELISEDLICHYFTIGDYLSIFEFSNTNKLDLLDLSLKDFIKIIVEDKIYKKDKILNKLIYDFIELYYLKKEPSEQNYLNFDDHIRSVNNMSKFNLDTESIFLRLHQNLN